MAPAARRSNLRGANSNRPPLTSTPVCESNNQNQIDNLVEIFENSQNVTTTDFALSQIKRLYKSTNYHRFEEAFKRCVKKLLQSKHTTYFKTSCDFLCKFLEHVSKISPDQDGLIITCSDIADLYMQVINEDYRYNAVYFVSKLLANVESLDEEVVKALKSTLPKRIRDKKPIIRAQAVIASRRFQDDKMIREAFLYHFYRDPELVVRKALLQIMDTKVFGCDFLADSTQDSFEIMKKATYQRIGKIPFDAFNSDQIHKILHNGLNERCRQASFAFRTHALEPWLTHLYDGLDLINLLKSFNTLEYHDDICRLLKIVYERDLDKLENNGTSTKLHHVVESFRDNWLNYNNTCLPVVNQVDENVITVWLTLVHFCKTNQAHIKPVKLRTIKPGSQANTTNDHNESIEEILDTQERNDELVELYERLTPDLIHLVDFVKNFVKYSYLKLKNNDSAKVVEKLEFMYQQVMHFMMTYEIGDEIERKIVQEVLGSLLKENLLTGKFENFIQPIVTCLFKLIYSSSSNLMINYISELINNVRSHLEDMIAFTQPKMMNSSIATQGTARPNRITSVSEVSHMSMVVENEPNFDGKFSSTMLVSANENSITESQMTIINREDLRIFKHHTNDLIKCLQMYFACLQNVKITEVPITMTTHLAYLSLESLDDWFKEEKQVRSLMVACNGLTALVDEKHAQEPTTMTLLIASLFDPDMIELRTTGFRCLVDVIIQHESIDYPLERIERFLQFSLKDYGKYNRKDSKKNELDFATSLIEGTTKLFYYQKICSAPILAHLILWWYHPTTDSKLKQFIGVFLPLFVKHLTNNPESIEWLKDLLSDTYVLSIENLHNYIIGEGYNIMSASDIHSMINFLRNLVPIAFHPEISVKLEERIDDLGDRNQDLVKYLKQSRNSLTSCEVVSTPKRPHDEDELV